MLTKRNEELIENIMPSIWRILMECANCKIDSIRIDFGDVICVWKEDKVNQNEKEKKINVER